MCVFCVVWCVKKCLISENLERVVGMVGDLKW